MLRLKEFVSKRNTLFTKLLSSYVALIVLLLFFNLLTFSFFSNNVQRETIRNNELTLSNTVQRYESHLHLIYNTIIQFYFNSRVILLNNLGESLQFEAVNQIAGDVKDITSNDLLYLDNLVLQFRYNDFVIDKHGANSMDRLFSKNYVSSEYDVRFWHEQQFQEWSNIKVLPQTKYNDRMNVTVTPVIPMIIKNKIVDQLYITAFLNADKLFDAFHNPNQEQFYILDDDNRLIYSSVDEPLKEQLIEQIASHDDYVKDDHTYYFHRNSEELKLTYISVVPNHKISEELSQFNMTLILMFIVVLAVSFIISYVLSVKFNNPIKKIIDAIQKGPNSTLQSNINEYNFIYDNVNHFIQANQDFRVDLKRYIAQLRYFSYLQKVKNIKIGDSPFSEDLRPFYLIQFHLKRIKPFEHIAPEDQNRVVFYIIEFIKLTLSERYDDSITLQIEKDQILSLVFTEQDADLLLATMHRLKRVFDQDKDYYCFTIAVRPILRSSFEFNESYNETLEMIRLRKLSSETQIIIELPEEPLIFGFTPAQEQEFLNHLDAGQENYALALITRQLHRMERNGNSDHQFKEFTKEIIAKTLKIMITKQIDISSVFDMQSYYQNMENCIDLEDYLDLSNHFISRAMLLIAEKKREKDPFKDAMINFVHNNYAKNVSLEMLADEFGFSIHYISRYFKERTGLNFIDYLTSLRIQKSKELLLTTNLKVQDIAEHIGYTTANSFIRMFRKSTGMAPGEFRKLSSMRE